MKAFFCLLIFVRSSIGLDCFKSGQCLDSFILDVTEAEGPQQCLQECKDSSGCNWFTYNPNYPYCELLRDCPKYSDAFCPECISGEVDCDLYQCNIHGRCQGYGIDIGMSPTADRCLQKCKETELCQWYSFRLASQTCITFRTCDNLDETDTEFVSGQVDCTFQQSGYTKLLVATGSPYETSVAVEVFDLVDDSVICEALEDFPVQVAAASGGLINNSVPIICGGLNNFRGDCHIPGNTNDGPLATLITPRSSTASIAMGNTLWITGGAHVFNNSPLSSTEIVDDLAIVVDGPELPMTMFGHCIVKLNQTTFLFMYERKTFFYDYSNQVWSCGPDMKYKRTYFGCGKMTSANGSVVVVAAGGAYSRNTTEFLDFDGSKDLKWSAGPDLPKHLLSFSMVEFDHTVVTVGGNGNDDGELNVDTIHKLVCSAADSSCEWIEMRQKLRVARQLLVAIMVPDELTNCQKT